VVVAAVVVPALMMATVAEEQSEVSVPVPPVALEPASVAVPVAVVATLV